MATVVYWMVIVTASAIVLYKMHIAAEYNVAGVKRIKGKLVQVMYPDHYTFFGTYLCYWWGAFIIVFLLYLASAFLLDTSGYSDIWGIQTGFRKFFAK